MSVLRPLVVGLLVGALLLRPPDGHAARTNDGFVDVATAAATSASIAIKHIGTLAPGVAPVFGTGGLLFIGNEQGTLFAFRPDGTQIWKSQLPNLRGIKASAVVGADGSVYVVGVTGRRSRHGTLVGQQSTLFKFNAGGGLQWQADFPAVNQENGYTTAPPNIWSSGGAEVIMVPAIYRTSAGVALHLDAFSTQDGHVLADTIVTDTPVKITAEGLEIDWTEVAAVTVCVQSGFLCPGLLVLSSYNEPHIPDLGANAIIWNGQLPLPGVAVFTMPGGGTPFVIVSDGLRELVGYTFQLPGRFSEAFRTHDATRAAASAPMVLPDGHSVVGTNNGRITFSGPNFRPVNDVWILATSEVRIYATPSRTADGRVITVGYQVYQGALVTMLQNDFVHSVQQFVPGQSIAAVGVSRNDIFVATASSLVTFDANNLARVGQFPWTGGGLWPPAIGPDGRVYGIVANVPPANAPPGTVFAPSNTLFIFPPPVPCVACRIPPSPLPSRQIGPAARQ